MSHLLSNILLSPLNSGQAYLDPGSGSFILQLIIAGAVGALFALRAYYGRIKAFFKRSTGEEEAPEATPEDEN